MIVTSRLVRLVHWRQDEAAHRIGEDEHEREEVEVEHDELESHHFVDQAVQLVHQAAVKPETDLVAHFLPVFGLYVLGLLAILALLSARGRCE